MAAVGKGPHFLQKNPPIEFSGYGPVIRHFIGCDPIATAYMVALTNLYKFKKQVGIDYHSPKSN